VIQLSKQEKTKMTKKLENFLQTKIQNG